MIMLTNAVISPCGAYRYALTRRWDDGPSVCWIMLNPSTADAIIDDPTIRRCIGFTKRQGYAALTVVNLFALRATNPVALRYVADPVGPDNDNRIMDAATTAEVVIAAWGAHGGYLDRDKAVKKLLVSRPLMCLGRTKSGCPKHPLYLPTDTEFIGL